MLKKRIIPVLLYDGFQCVKPVSFQRPYRKLGSMDQYIQVMEERDVDELIFIDIEATPNKRPPDFVKIARYATTLMCPLAVGGGIYSLDHIRQLLLSGADKVIIKSKIELIPNAARKFGKQAIVACLEYSLNDLDPLKLIAQAKALESYGAGELLIVCREADGTMEGYDLGRSNIITNELNIPVIVCGGCKDPQDMLCAFNYGFDAVAAGSMFLYSEHTPRSCAKYLQENLVETRVE